MPRSYITVKDQPDRIELIRNPTLRGQVLTCCFVLLGVVYPVAYLAMHYATIDAFPWQTLVFSGGILALMVDVHEDWDHAQFDTIQENMVATTWTVNDIIFRQKPTVKVVGFHRMQSISIEEQETKYPSSVSRRIIVRVDGISVPVSTAFSTESRETLEPIAKAISAKIDIPFGGYIKTQINLKKQREGGKGIESSNAGIGNPRPPTHPHPGVKSVGDEHDQSKKEQ